ncbi:hypothetical protein RGQ29_027267 [Quercus rubra]|uniref:F-box domain-containing protein n=1 Tax=Quercus rubra TaxID=3512 RepID=A0AAN7ENM9_QUERU|nr:hypothetical protein RGQ29_027267 [Quercus rubra]KAK4576648.1 hypothetical protein RGQ29_027267 [Quercus rubra]KAK4576649.1 hypothetical protein RGQ29_027267 [Quercus rubra]
MSDNLPELSRSIPEEAIMCDSHSLPPEILLDIIIRLPIKSIITCTSVCKTWKSLIQNPSFISDHLRHSTTKYLLFSLYSKTAWQVYRIPHEQGREHYALHWDDNQDFNEYTKFYFPLLHGQERFRVVGTCNGLICLANYICCDTVIIWNPCIRKFVQVSKPLPLPNIPPFRYSVSVGFGIDSKTSDYKVARILSFRDRKSASPPKLEVEVYSLATAEWKTLTTALPPTGTECYGNPHASVNGALHWVASRRTKDNMLIKFVMVLDLGDEVFSEIAMPKFAENERNLPSTISAYGNSLALYQEVSMNYLNIWLMKEYGNASSWTKVVILADQGPRYYRPSAKGFRKSGEVILKMNDTKFISRDLETQEIKDLGNAGYYHTYVDYYVESLVLNDKKSQLCSY